MFTVIFKKGKALYQQIYAQVIEEIRQGHLQAGDALPSKRACARHLGVSVNTVSAAYDQLADEGYVVAKPRSGFYVDKIVPSWLSEPIHEKPLPVESKESLESYRFDFSYHRTDPQLSKQAMGRSAQKAMDYLLTEKPESGWGLEILKGQLQEYFYQHRATRLQEEQILITSGARESLYILSQLFPQALFAVENPGYQGTPRILSSYGHQCLPVPVDQYGFSVKDLEKTKANVAIITPNHQFPLGMIMGIRRSQRILAWVSQSEDRYIIEDMYDADLKYAGMAVPPLKSMDKEDRVILMGTFSHLLGPILGISYLVLPLALVERLHKLGWKKTQAAPPSQALLAFFMAQGDYETHINKLNVRYKQKRKAMVEALKSLPGIKILGQEAGLYLLVRLDPTEWGLSNPENWQSLEKASVYVQKLSDFYIGDWPHQDLLCNFAGFSLEEIPQAVHALLGSFKG